MSVRLLRSGENKTRPPQILFRQVSSSHDLKWWRQRLQSVAQRTADPLNQNKGYLSSVFSILGTIRPWKCSGEQNQTTVFPSWSLQAGVTQRKQDQEGMLSSPWFVSIWLFWAMVHTAARTFFLRYESDWITSQIMKQKHMKTNKLKRNNNPWCHCQGLADFPMIQIPHSIQLFSSQWSSTSICLGCCFLVTVFSFSFPQTTHSLSSFQTPFKYLLLQEALPGNPA